MAAFSMWASCVARITVVAMLVMSVSMDLKGVIVFVVRRGLSLPRTRTARHESNGSPLQREGCYQKPEQVTDKYVHEP
jgi:hypothetical protein